MSKKEKIQTLISDFEHLAYTFLPPTGVEVIQGSSFPYHFIANYGQANYRESLTYTLSHYLTFDPTRTPSIQKIPYFPSFESDIEAQGYSPSRNLRVVFRNYKEKKYLEIWTKNNVPKTILVTDFHDAVYNSPVFGMDPIRWSQDEKRILYIAEKKEDKKVKYFDEFKEDKDAQKALQQFEYKEDFGEGIAGKKSPVVFIYDFEEDALFKVANIPEDIVPLQISFADKEGKTLLFCGLKWDLFNRGLLYCFNRETAVYYLDKLILERVKEDPNLKEEEKKALKEKITQEAKETKPTRITNEDISFMPLPNKDFSKFVYFFSPKQNSHSFVMGLKSISLNPATFPKEINPKLVVDIVKEHGPTFSGLQGYHHDFGSYSWFSDNIHMAFHAYHGLSLGIYLLNTETSEILRIDQPKYKSERWTILKVYNDTIFASISNLEGNTSFAIYHGIDLKAGKLEECTKSAKWHIFNLETKQLPSPVKALNPSLNNIGEIKEEILNVHGIQSLMFYLKDFKDKDGNVVPLEKRPLALDLHGGPHGAVTGFFYRPHYYLLNKGYIIVNPAFSGSVGYGQNHIDALPGQIGIKDAEEVKATLDYILENKMADPNKLLVMGGSYGGYFTGLMIAKYPTLFKCAVIYNPVINIPFNAVTTDIPDWSYFEVFNTEMILEPTSEHFKKMWEYSPVSMNRDIKSSVLLMVGGKDQRCPPQQSIHYYKVLKQKGVDVTFYYYPDEGHSLAGDLYVRMDDFVKFMNFIDEKMPK